MLSAIRAFAKSWVAAVLIGLLIVSFAVFGTRDMFRGVGARDAVVKAGSRTLTQADFKRMFDNYRDRAAKQSGQAVSAEQAVEAGLDQRLVNELAASESFAELLRRSGIRPAPSLVIAELRKNPGLFDPITGRFDQTVYEQRLAENGLTPAKFESYLRDDIAQTHMVSAVVNGLKAPRAYAALGGAYLMQASDVTYFTIEPTSVPQPKAPTDAQLTAFMKENAARLTRPETRLLTVVRFSAKAMAPDIKIDPAEVQRRFAFRKDSLSTAETRSLVQIPAKDAAVAKQIQQRLTAGEDPAAIAKSLGVEPLTYTDQPKTAVADRGVADTAFSLPVGAVAPVSGQLGASVVKVLSIKPGHEATLEQARPQIEAELRTEAAQDKVYDLTQKYDDAHASGDSLTQAAAKVGVTAVSLGPISAQGVDASGEHPPALSPKLVKTAFSLPKGGESEIVEDGKGEYFVVRVDRINPAAPPPLAEIKPQLTRVWMLREVAKAMQARADGYVARINKGETLEKVAASAGAKVTNVVGVDRAGADKSTALSRDALGKVFAAKPGEVFTAENTRFGMIVGRVQKVRQAPVEEVAKAVEPQRQQLTVDLFQGIGDSARQGARELVKPRVSIEQARRAVGVDPDFGEPAKDAKDAKK